MDKTDNSHITHPILLLNKDSNYLVISENFAPCERCEPQLTECVLVIN